MLRTSFRQGSAVRALGESDATLTMSGSHAPAAAALKEDVANGEITQTPITPHPPMLEPPLDSALEAFSRLNEAARRIERADAGHGRRLPRASRLAPFRDISAEIRRESTPMPNYTKMQNGRNSQKLLTPPADRPAGSTSEQDEKTWKREQELQNVSLPDDWPWFDEIENEDIWANRTDPLITRHRPNSVEAALIEQEDIRRAMSEGISTGHVPSYHPGRRKSPLRNIFIALAIFAVVALSIDAVLLAALSQRSHNAPAPRNGLSAALLVLTPNEVQFVKGGPTQALVQVQISNFASRAQVALTRDNQETLQTTQPHGSALLTLGANGSGTITIMVTADWGSGPNSIYAEDIKTHNTASATLLVIGATSSIPPHLEVSSTSSKPVTSLDFGQGYQGTDQTIPLDLKNTSPSGSITWTASSNQPWLLVSPNAGTFNQEQEIEVAIQRGMLPVQSYTGAITLYSNVGAPLKVPVSMSVAKAPPGLAVLSLSPAALSFVATDGSPVFCSQASQYQTLTISNPGSKTLNWSLTPISSAIPSTQIAIAHALGTSVNWLIANPSSGSIPASSNTQVSVCAQSSSLLPGAYLGALQFSAPRAADASQSVSVSLTVQPHCGLVAQTGFLTFTAVQGKASTTSQALGLNATSSCTGSSLSWAAQVSAPSWLSVNPASGKLTGTTAEYLTVSVNPTGLAPQAYVGYLVFSTANSTQTVLVRLIVQQLSAGAPIMSASPLNLNFSSTNGQPGPKGQVVTITNNGGGPLHWNSSPLQFALSWLSVSPTGGTIAPGQTGSMIVNVDTSKLSPGTYSGQVTLNGMDSSGVQASGSPQVISVNLVVQPPCMLTQPSLSSLSFSAVQGGSNPDLQPVLITGTGNCAWPLTIITTSSASWLLVNTPDGPSIRGNGQSDSLDIGPNIGTLAASSTPYTAQVTISATDSAGILAQGSGQTISVALTIQPPCTFSPPAPSSLTFTVDAGASAGTAQTVALGETGTCARPISYRASPSASWLVPTTTADSGSGGSLTVNVNPGALPAGTYTGTITVTAFDTNKVPVSGSVTIGVSMTVVVYSVSGSVTACTGVPPACLTPQPLPGATVTVMNGSTTVATVTADASGNYSITGLPAGNYTVNVSGTIGITSYSATGIPLSVSANATGVNFDAYGV